MATPFSSSLTNRLVFRKEKGARTERRPAIVSGKYVAHVEAQADHPLFVWPLLLVKSEHRSFVLNRRNTDEHYRGYNN